MPDRRNWHRSMLLGTGTARCARPKCGAYFIRTSSRHVYCSRRCAVTQYSVAVFYPKYRKREGVIERPCGHCAKLFEQPASQRRKREYCSGRCKSAAGRRRRHKAVVEGGSEVAHG